MYASDVGMFYYINMGKGPTCKQDYGMISFINVCECVCV